MSEFQVRVVRLGAIRRHPKADRLSITDIGGPGGYPCILGHGPDGVPEFREGDLAVYVPATALVPADDPRWRHLLPKGSTVPVAGSDPDGIEIEPVRLRGIFSMGVLTRAEPGWQVGQDVAAELRIVRAEPPEPTEGNEPDPGLLPTYTDIVSLRAYPNVLVKGEEVVITEKLEGACSRYVVDAERLYCGSRTAWKDPLATQKESAHWWEIGRRLELERRLREVDGGRYGIFGEAIGGVSKFQYGLTRDRYDLRIFDAMDVKTRTYLDYDVFLDVARRLDIPTAPLLYRGPWTNDLRKLAEGNSTIAEHLREGIVIRPVRERFHEEAGRVILKLHGEGYCLVKKGRRKEAPAP